MDRLIQEEVDVRLPRGQLQCWARKRKLTNEVSQNVVHRRYQYILLVDEVRLSEVDGCGDREEAIARVASQAEGMLSSGKAVAP